MKVLKAIGAITVIVLIVLGLSLLGNREGPAVEACASAYILPLITVLGIGLASEGAYESSPLCIAAVIVTIMIWGAAEWGCAIFRNDRG